MNLANMHTYVMKQALNSECDVFYEYFCKKDDDPKIDAVILIDAAAHEDDGEWKGLTQVMKTFISQKNATLKAEITKEITQETKQMLDA